MIIRPAGNDDRQQWNPLWQGYLEFYQTVLSAEQTELTWKRLMDPAEPMHALVAEDAGTLVGFAHYLYHRSTWAPDFYCYLEDLFTASEARGQGIGRALIEAVAQAAQERGSTHVYWLTHETNRQAMRLYDKVASRTGFLVYNRRPGVIPPSTDRRAQ